MQYNSYPNLLYPCAKSQTETNLQKKKMFGKQNYTDLSVMMNVSK